MSLWQVPEMLASVQCLLEVFYQMRLEFTPEDLDVLEAIKYWIENR